MKRERIELILRALFESGVAGCKMGKTGMWLFAFPVKVKTWHIVNEDGFTPHKVEGELTAAKLLVLGFGKHEPLGLRWKPTGAVYWPVVDEDDAIAALASFGFDLRAALARHGDSGVSNADKH
jgi:hypothetical protein